MRHLRNGTLQKTCLFGDQIQLGPTTQSLNVNEFAKVTGDSCMAWAIWHHGNQNPLTQQYRSHPEIADFVSKEYCQGMLVNDLSILATKTQDTVWKSFTKRKFGTSSHNIFVDAEGSHSLPHSPSDTYLVNPTTTAAIVKIIRRMQSVEIKVLLMLWQSGSTRPKSRYSLILCVMKPLESLITRFKSAYAIALKAMQSHLLSLTLYARA